MTWVVKFFQSSRGTYPVKEFTKKLDPRSYSRIVHSIELLESYGPFLKPPYIKKLRNRLYELRVTGLVTVRIFYTFYKDTYYLIHAFKKKSQKTPAREIKTALDRIRELI